MLRAGAHQHAAGIGARGVVVEDVFIVEVARALGGAVVDEQVVVGLLLSVGHDGAVGCDVGAGSGQDDVRRGARQTAGQRHVVAAQRGVGADVGIDVGQPHVAGVGLLHAVQADMGAGLGIDLGDVGGQGVAGRRGMVAEQQGQRGAGLGHDEQAAVGHEGACGGHDLHDLYGVGDGGAGGGVYQQTVLRQHGVEGGQTVGALGGGAVVVALHQGGAAVGGLGQGADGQALGQGGGGRSGGRGAVVDHVAQGRG